MGSSFGSWDDGWSVHHDIDRILHGYETIYDEIVANPIEVKPKKADFHQFDHDEVVSKPRFFTPPLQHQRNQFVRDTLNLHIEGTGEKIRKLAVLGCGSLSLERFLMTSLGEMGVERVLSVDIDGGELAKGLRLLNVSEHLHEDFICNSHSLPVLLEVYQGDIIEYDERLAGSACVCSTEVVEHIPEIDARRFVRSVLRTIQPDLFIISTPNHEYNEAFGLPPGKFRHDDHKFEFSRQQFRNWLCEIINEFTPFYAYMIKYVGVLKGFAHLGGATQFGIISRMRKHSMVTVHHPNLKVYRKVGEIVLRNSLFILQREKVKQGFILWLQNNRLLKDHLIQSSAGGFWRVDVGEVLQNVELPKQLKNQLDKQTMVDVLRFLCKGQVICGFYNHEFCLNIPHNMTVDRLINVVISDAA
ncbi:hypothetical protein KIN20_035020 [Parelaphostrongylus tenuis]|uniref:Small RNA 2'-O-methyltransferase n=1 Tax=Parelaphostrongylus tenuis TaxID=148309 RepID=A0AAD5WJM3_PARTN|nr:hypothetical protein KIN20_035020 [Parelaphostrongylus tenuis]